MTSALEQSLLSAWAIVDAPVGGGSINTHPIAIEIDGSAVRAGIDHTGARHLLVPVSGVDGAPRDQRSGGVALVPQELQVDGRNQMYADLVCTRPELQDVFAALAADVCGVLEEDEAHPSRVVVEVLDRWRRLLSPASGERPAFDMAAVIGLQGELAVLERALEAGGADVVAAWSGPSRAQHDFRTGDLAIEVKTTTAREGLAVEIHGLEQMDSSAEVRLALAVVQIIPDVAGDSLPVVVERLLSQPIDAGELLTKLREVGYDHGRTPSPTADGMWPSFVRVGLWVWWVGEDFPVIRRSHLPAAAPASIVRLRYTINMAGAGQPMGEDEREAVFAEIGGAT